MYTYWHVSIVYNTIFFVGLFILKIWSILKDDLLFAHPNGELTIDQKRELTYKRAKRLIEYDFLSDQDIMENPSLAVAFQDAVAAYDPALLQVISLSISVSIIHGKIKILIHNISSKICMLK